MMGYPGAGKTTTADAIHQLTGAVHLASDKVRLQINPKPSFNHAEHVELYKTLDKMTEQLLGEGKDVIYDANLNRYQHRLEKYDICNRLNAQPILVWVQTEKTLAKQRAVDEERAHLVPQNETASDMFDRIAAVIEPPRTDEQPILVDGTKVSPDYINSLLFKK